MLDTGVEVPVNRTPRPVAARLTSLARAEALLVRRSKLVLYVAFVMPIVPFLSLIGPHNAGKLDTKMTSFAMTGSMACILLFVVFYNLLPTFVARREELVLKRLRTGECSDVEILTGIALPAFLISAIMMLGVSVAAVAALGQRAPVNPVLLLVALVGGCLVYAALSLVSAVFTKNSEAAQISSMPVMAISMLGLGSVMPLGNIPDWVGALLAHTPLAPVLELTQLGWSGVTGGGATVDFAGSFAHAWHPTLTLVAWVLICGWLARRYMRWEPRN